ncbi:MAG TPA: hypothetical protein VK504_12730 [Vicinamibacterales bacterium]|nr:hypothetical protein [Vicinamibacterales bacterium]
MVSKPRAGARPRSSHPHAQGLRHCFLFNEGSGRLVTDCVGGLQLSFSGTSQTSWAANSRGPVINNVSGGGLQLIAGGKKPYGAFNQNLPFTIVAEILQTNGNQGGYRCVWSNQGGNGFYINGGKPEFFNTGTALQTLSTDVPHIISVSASGPNAGVNLGAGEFDYHIDGRLDSVTNYTNWGAISAWTSGLVCLNDSLNEVIIGQIGFLYVYDRYLGDGSQTAAAYNQNPVGARGLMQSLHADPYSMFLPGQKYWLFSQGGLGTNTGTAAVSFQHPVLAAAGTSYDTFEGVGAVGISHPLLAGVGTSVSNIVGTGAVSIRHPLLSAQGFQYFGFGQCEDWPSDPIVPGTDPLVP